MQIHNASIEKYEKLYSQNPLSKFFAPLAECYRKIGKLEEAIHIAQAGLIHHPHFTAGKMVLCRALYEKKDYKAALSILLSITENNPDNIAAQKLLAQVYTVLEQKPEALKAYKNLLLYAPYDQKLALMINQLETESIAIKNQLLQEESFTLNNIQNVLSQDPKMIQKIKVKKIEKITDLLLRLERHKKTFTSD